MVSGDLRSSRRFKKGLKGFDEFSNVSKISRRFCMVFLDFLRICNVRKDVAKILMVFHGFEGF